MAGSSLAKFRMEEGFDLPRIINLLRSDLLNKIWFCFLKCAIWWRSTALYKFGLVIFRYFAAWPISSNSSPGPAIGSSISLDAVCRDTTCSSGSFTWLIN
jgi:hypothetical protein